MHSLNIKFVFKIDFYINELKLIFKLFRVIPTIITTNERSRINNRRHIEINIKIVRIEEKAATQTMLLTSRLLRHS